MSQPYYPSNGQLVAHLRKPFGSLGMVTPRLTIDGYPAPAQWGPNAYPVAPGRHLVKGSANYLWEFGSAEQVVEINPGQSVDLHYSPPLITFIGGRMGFSEQPRPGHSGVLGDHRHPGPDLPGRRSSASRPAAELVTVRLPPG